MPTAYFFLSDICRYTAYLAGSELDHAQEILGTLFETLLGNIQPPLKIAKLEGDAIFAYLPAEQICYGQTILDTVESMYVAFRRVRKAMRLNTTCTCRACRGINTLDLKFFVHHGEYVVQRLMGQEELAGPAVILAHRLLKNTVTEKTGLTAYALFTKGAIEAMQAHEAAASFTRLMETYEHLGSTEVYVYDMHPYWERIEKQLREFVRPEDASAVASIRIPAPPAVTWDILTNPLTRSRVVGGAVRAENHRDGRVGIGSVYHCAHHDGTSSEAMIIDWQPLEYITTHEVAHEPGMDIFYRMTCWLEAQPEDKSRVIVSISAPHAGDPAQQPALEAMWPQASLELVQHLEEHAAQAYAQIAAERGIQM